MKEHEIEAQFLTDTGEAFDIPEGGSLGLLAYGYKGIMAWRTTRQKLKEQRLEQEKKTERNNGK